MANGVVTGSGLRRARSRKSAGRRILAYQVFLVIAIFALWELAIQQQWIKAYLYGQPSGIWREFIKAISDGSLLNHTWVTAYESILGFVIGGVLGSAAGLAMWLSPTLAKVLRPVMVALNGVPKIALAPLIIVWFGVGFESKVAIAAIICFIVAIITAYAGTQEIDDDLIRLMRSLGASRWQIFQKVVVPGCVPWLISGFRLNVGFALIGAVVGEYISAEVGLGFLVYYSGTLYNLGAVWVGILTLMVLALVMDFAVGLVERRLRWRFSD